MGKFDGVLIATDWDGTFFSNNQLYEKNLEAIRRFQSEGGRFTICTGRFYDFIKGFADQVIPNTYVICYGGAYIVDPVTEEVMYKGFCDEYLFTILKSVITPESEIAAIYVYDESSPDGYTYTLSEYFDNIDFIRGLNIYKTVVRFLNEEAALAAMRIADEVGLGDYIAVRSWKIGLEFLKKENAKGAALRRVGEKIGAKLTVGVGDYENDIEMIKDADIGYAVENACDALKAVADRITVHVSESAIAAIIADIERDLAEK